MRSYCAHSVGGKAKAPVDDCGGIWGYYNMVEAINDKKHPEHKDFMEWLGLGKNEKWDEKEFDLDESNQFLQEVWMEWMKAKKGKN